ncbi:hypothetical protein DW920_00285 [Clostridium sp. AM42-36]|jgi:serine phosphatase RsbU (regulator of sigma subunit)|nr:hypothetical protein DWV19_01540 [Clostridiaceae bacterium AF02-42]RHS89098.1 hypothetical protein DW920_00285 [Clostridium sp. AM42-36]UVY42366.1 MAG: DNA packaging protein FI [Bacteriophage sp.]
MKGYLDAKELESYKKEDLQELAKQLGVDAEGTKKEIATRCAAVEVDIPDESELTEEDKRAAAEAAAEAAAKAEEERKAAEAAAKAEEERKAAEAAAKAEEERKAAAKAEEEEAATELVKVKAQRRFLDKELNQIKDTGDEYAVSRERAAVLEEAGVAAVIEE